MKLIAVGLCLLLLGALLPFLMVLRILEPSFTLSFLSYASSLVGLAVGLYGAIMLSLSKRQKED